EQTNKLEGVSSTRKEINDILDNSRHKNDRLYGIVNKYAMLMSCDELPLKTCSDIRALYDDLVFDEVILNNPENAPDGAIFRKGPVYVKNKRTGKIIHTGIMPEAKIIEYMSSMLSALNSSEYDRLINIAVFHYLFGYIHPFYDGNGRMSRFISSYLLADILEPIVSYRIAYTIKNDINKYYKMFSLTNDKINSGDMTGFVIYFIELINNALCELNSTFSEYGAMLTNAKEIIDNYECDELSKQLYYILLLNALFGETGLTVEELGAVLCKSASTVRSRLASLDRTKIRIDRDGKQYRYSADINKF
ncbi:MAG: Fic family protein, partial [Candidatus Ornithomonoglobus sp.]